MPLKQTELEVKDPNFMTGDCGRLKFTNHLGTKVYCHGTVVYQKSIDPRILYGKCSTCGFIHGKK